MRIVFVLLVLAGLVGAVYLKRHEIVDRLQQWSLGALKPPAHIPAVTDRSLEAAKRVTPGLKQELQAKGLRFGDPVYIRIFKESDELELWVQKPGSPLFELFKTYEICRWSGELGPKLKEGDRQAPEGFYFVTRGRLNPKSRFHLSFDLGYPNAYDRFHGRTGSYLMVHGACVSIGCYAMTDPRIEEIYTLVEAALDNGQPYFRVHCFPFRMSDERMDKALAAEAEWLEFWANLKEGYDYFELMRKPPNTTLHDGRYVFE